MNNKIFERFKEYVNTAHFNALRISIASPERITALSYGEVKKIETINYRTLKPERDGLFCARIFGPQKDWECNCGKYKRMKHRGVTCEKCGVEVIQARVRRERMGHINLVSPVCHIWFLKGIPSHLSMILNMTVRDLERVTYFDSYIVINQGNSPYSFKTLLTSMEYDDYTRANPDDIAFKAEMGAEAIKELLLKLDLEFEVRKIEQELEQTTSIAVRHKYGKRLKVLSRMHKAAINPAWIVMHVLPVIPPDLRPLVPLEGGRFASSDLNDLYRRVLNRNIRLRRLIELDAPDVIVKNEKRMLQESVDALIDNGRRGQPVRGQNKRPLKSLSEMLRGKQGRFRQNLLGKRVDYSGRSVIVVDPELPLDKCGLPKLMALELFKPYVYVELQRRELAPNLRVTKKMVEDMVPEVWEALETVVANRPVLLNRAPTLHRLGIQAFFPILVEGKAIKIHPLVCAAFNADFDGDQMAVHVPLSQKAQMEAKNLMLSTKNILSPANGKPIMVPSQDMVLGLYYITKGRKNVPGQGLNFSNIAEVIAAYQRNVLAIHAIINVRHAGEMIETTVGRVLVYETMPAGAPFDWCNRALKKKDIVKLVARVYRQYGQEDTVVFLDRIKKVGFFNATQAGLSLSVDNLLIPVEKKALVAKAHVEVERIEKLYVDGAITNGERHNKVIQTWARATDDVANFMIGALQEQDRKEYLNEDKNAHSNFNPVFLMLDSGARSSKQQIRQLGGMRGLMAKPSGEIMETPVLANFKDGLNVFEYFISTHGARKGLSDTALKTADSGYLTRRLVDVAQDVVVTERDCNSFGFVTMTDLREAGDVLEPLEARVFGRVIARDVHDPITGVKTFAQGELATQEVVERFRTSAVFEVPVRSTLMCQARRGVCSECYGLDLATSKRVEIGLAVGIIAAQSIGEPGTQLTMRTFHIGGTASGLVEQNMHKATSTGKIVFKNVEFVMGIDNQRIAVGRKGRMMLIGEDGRELDAMRLEYGAVLYVTDGQAVKLGDKLAEWDGNNKVIVADKGGIVAFSELIENITYQDKFDETTGKSRKVILERKEEKRQPCITLVSDDRTEIARYYLPTQANLYVEEGERIMPGTVLAKLNREEQRTKDITGGLPRVAELFEARIPKDTAIISEANGLVRFEGLYRGNRKIVVQTDEGEIFEYSVPRSKHLNVEDGDRVSVGDPITSGTMNVHDILRVLGPDELQKYLVKEIQEIYALQGVIINDKHIELIIRQMLKKVRIIDAGDTDFIVGDRVDKTHFQRVNEVVLAEDKRVATARPILMGITKASLGTDSVISAASFQETTRVLAEAAIEGKIDYLYGLKENVIIGKLIPAGTGVASFRLNHLGEDVSPLERQAREEEQLEMSLDEISLDRV
ncbi:MAG: DNA-directed polymerase subunit beta [Candidatus Dependentiae bacterium]|nr:DNA-directed polymerase subunit beta [Candidatus Dependentiae bacterium]